MLFKLENVNLELGMSKNYGFSFVSFIMLCMTKTSLLDVSKTCFEEIYIYSVKGNKREQYLATMFCMFMCSGVAVDDCLLCASFVLSISCFR